MSAILNEYEKATQKYQDLLAKARAGDKEAHKVKAVAMDEIRVIERTAARNGEVLDYTVDRTGKVKCSSKPSQRKRSLQEEYVRRFDPENVVLINGAETTLQEHHAKRLLGK